MDTLRFPKLGSIALRWNPRSFIVVEETRNSSACLLRWKDPILASSACRIAFKKVWSLATKKLPLFCPCLRVQSWVSSWGLSRNKVFLGKASPRGAFVTSLWLLKTERVGQLSLRGARKEMVFVCPSLRGASQVKNEKLMSWKTHRNRTWNCPDVRSVKTKPCGGNAAFLVVNTKFGVLRALIITLLDDGLTWGIPIRFRSKISLPLIGPLSCQWSPN